MVSLDSTRSVVTDSGLAGSLAASAMPFLKPLTAPPRSSPMLRSFLVPKMSATMTRTISQCQMLKLPMFISVVRRMPRVSSRGRCPFMTPFYPTMASRAVAAAGFLGQTRGALAASQFAQDVLGPQIIVGQCDKTVKPEVGRFVHDAVGGVVL